MSKSLGQFQAACEEFIKATREEMQQPAPTPAQWQPWKPDYGQKYWLLNSVGEVGQDAWCETQGDIARYEMGNVFRTEEEAIRERDKRRVTHKLRVLAKGFVPDWDTTFQQKWEIYYNYETEELSEAWRTSCRDASTGDVYFANREDAKNARLTLGDELLVLFDVVKGE